MHLDFIKRLGRWLRIYMTAIERVSNGVLNTPSFISPSLCCFLLSLLSSLYFPMPPSHPSSPSICFFQSLWETSLVVSLFSLIPFTHALSLWSTLLVYQGKFSWAKTCPFLRGIPVPTFKWFLILQEGENDLDSHCAINSKYFPTLIRSLIFSL